MGYFVLLGFFNHKLGCILELPGKFLKLPKPRLPQTNDTRVSGAGSIIFKAPQASDIQLGLRTTGLKASTSRTLMSTGSTGGLVKLQILTEEVWGGPAMVHF